MSTKTLLFVWAVSMTVLAGYLLNQISEQNRQSTEIAKALIIWEGTHNQCLGPEIDKFVNWVGECPYPTH